MLVPESDNLSMSNCSGCNHRPKEQLKENEKVKW
jgi:hypothetical protein